MSSTRDDGERYIGKPMLRMLELYVLWSIDQLPAHTEAGLIAMSPKLANLFGGDGTWQSAIASTMDLPANMSELIQERWRHNCEIAANNAIAISPQQFAEMFVDANLT